MLYALLKFPARLALFLYCRKLKIRNPEILQHKGPLLIASNHPNSFLDAIIVATLFKKPVYSLARGDAFRNKFISGILHQLNILPVYRQSEGADNLEHNYRTFDRCREIFQKNGIVLIFSEGLCINEWKLRPLKKGTARLSISCWQQGIPLQVIPLGINYSSFRRFGKSIHLNFGTLISKEDIAFDDTHGRSIAAFNQQLNLQLMELVVQAGKKDTREISDTFHVPVSVIKNTVLFVPSVAGLLLNIPLYFLVKKTVQGINIHKEHFDSIIVGMLFLTYPIYLALIFTSAFYFISWWALLVWVVLPFTAWSHVQLNEKF